jgi:uncharacterized protein
MPLKVNGEEIEERLILDEMERMRPEYDRTFQEMLPNRREDQLLEWATENVTERILLRKTARERISNVPAEAVNKAFRKLADEHGGEKALFNHLGIDPKDRKILRDELADQVRIEKLMQEITGTPSPVEEEKVRAYYQNHPQEFQRSEQVHAAHIVKHVDGSASPEEARRSIEEIQARLKGGERFEEVADEVSDCPGNGGDLGWFPRGQMVPAFEERVFGMEPGEVSDVFQSEFGFHIAKVYEKRAEDTLPLEDVRERIGEKLREEEKSRKLEIFIDRLKESAEIAFVPSANFAVERENLRARADRQRYPKQLTSLLVKPAGPDCNMACRYCFYLEKVSLFGETPVHRMSETILEEMIRQALAQTGQHISFGWQGGEPTLMGLDFFRKAVDFQKKYGAGRSVGNGLQTNGLLINDEWAGFLRENRFLLGLSLDGPEHVHDHYRKDRGGKGTWERVVRTRDLLLRESVAVNALVVVSDYSSGFAEEIYRFHRDSGMRHMQFIPCVETDPGHPDRAAPFSVGPEQYGRFLCEIFDLWYADFVDGEPTTSVRFFDSIFYRYVGRVPPECTLHESCGIYLVVEHNGDIYSCDFFVEPEWKLGNLKEDRLIDLLNSPRQNEFGKRKSILPVECAECRWLDLCRGGCPKDRVRDPGDRGLDHFCGAYQMFFQHADSRFRDLAEAWKKREAMTARQRDVARAAQHGNLKAGRNDPCPCGSGKKFKHCCGKGD